MQIMADDNLDAVYKDLASRFCLFPRTDGLDAPGTCLNAQPGERVCSGWA